MQDRTNSVELRILYMIAFIAIGYTLGMCFPARELWPETGVKVDRALTITPSAAARAGMIDK